MARYIGPKCKLARREGSDLYLKSARRSIDSKCIQILHLVNMVRNVVVCLTTVCNCAKNKKIRRIYGVLERQFRRYFAEAERRKGSTGRLEVSRWSRSGGLRTQMVPFERD